MCPVIRISGSTFQCLQKHAAPFVDTPETVIRRLLEFYESSGQQELFAAKHTRLKDEGSFDSDNHPDLHHSKIIEAEFDGRPASGWNELVRVAHERAMDHFQTFERLQSVTLANIRIGHHARDGYYYAPKADISIQYTDSNTAWRNSLHLAREIGCSLKVSFEWRNKDGAAFPGKTDVLSWKPKQDQ